MSTIAKKLTAEPTIASPQSPARAEVAGYVFNRFERVRNMRDQKQPLFRDRTLKQITDDNIKRFIQFKRRPVHKKDWQSNLASSTPNEKLIGVLSKLATRGMEARINSLEDPTVKEILREKIGNILLKKASIKNDDDFQIILEMLEAAEKGTVIGFEDWYHGKVKIRDVKSQDPETGELVFEEKIVKRWNDVRSRIVNIEDFFPGNIYVRPGKIQDMDDCFYRQVMTKDEFDESFGKYSDANLVQTTASLITPSTPFWKQSQVVGNEEVEVLMYFNKRSDEYVILANGIWINPVGKAVISPLPWNHKQLPFWAAVYQPLDANFFYGRSFIDTLISFVDAKDALFDRILDQMTLATSRPIITDGKAASTITRGFLQPNNVIEADWSDGKPKFEVVPIPDPPAISITLYQMLQQNLEQAGITAEVIGGKTPGQKTATQANIELQGAMQLVSLFLTLMEAGIRDKYRLRFPNILQFYSMPIHEGDENELKFKRIVMRDAQLTEGATGTAHIDIVQQPSLERVLGKKARSMGEVEYFEITPEELRNWESEVEIVPQSSIKMNEVQKQTLELNFQKIMAELYPDKANRDGLFDDLVRVFNKDPAKLKAQQQEGGIPGMGGQVPGMPQGPQMPPMPPKAPQPAMANLPIPA